jgi:hypothetical protein
LTTRKLQNDRSWRILLKKSVERMIGKGKRLVIENGAETEVQDGRVQSCWNGRPRFPWLPNGRKIIGDRNDGGELCK